ncbi:MAG: hypothetical protein OWU33_11665 [Firmicutes bacterium]|nr:hypothetical protein [Bacillota bacterium]
MYGPYGNPGVTRALREVFQLPRLLPGAELSPGIRYGLHGLSRWDYTLSVVTPVAASGWLVWLVHLAAVLLVNFIVALVWVTLFPTALRRCAEIIEKAPMRVLATGILGWVGWVVVVAVLTVLLITLPVAAVITLVGIFAAFAANAIVIQWVGITVVARARLSRFDDPYAALMVGASAVTLLEMVPGLGVLVKLALLVMGLGALIVERVDNLTARWP